MKKLLGILGTITIAGSGMAGLVGNAPTPEKNEINYLQTNDSEKLNTEQTQNSNINLQTQNEEISVFFEKLNNLSYKVLKTILDNYNNYFYVLLTTKSESTSAQQITTSLYKVSNFSNTLIHSEISFDVNHHPPLKFNDFSLDNNRNIYMATDEGIYKYDNKIDKKSKISNLGTEKISADNEGNILFKRKSSDFIYYLKNDEQMPESESEANLLRKISFSNISHGSPINVSSINFDYFNNIYINIGGYLFLVFKYDINPQQISGYYYNIKFFNFGNKNYLFSLTKNDPKLFYLKAGQTTVEEINIAKIKDFYLDKNNESFYLATERGIYKLNIEDNRIEKINNQKTQKISLDKSNNIYFFNSGYLNIIKEDKNFKILAEDGSDIYPYPVFENEYKKIISNNKKILLFQDNENGTYKTYSLNREKSWISDEEKQNDIIEENSRKIEEERKDKEREEWIGEEGKKREKEWKINKLREVQQYLEEKEKQGKLDSFGKKILACLKKHIEEGFKLGFGALGKLIGTAIGTAIAPGAGTVAGGELGQAVGKWIGGIVGDIVHETIPGEESCKF